MANLGRRLLGSVSATVSLLHTILVVIALNSWYHLLESMYSVTVTFLPQLCLGMAYQHTLSNHHQLNASNPGWRNFALHLQVPSLLIVVFISHSHTPLLYLHTVYIALSRSTAYLIGSHALFSYFYLYLYFFIYVFFLRRGWSPCTTMLSLSPVHYRNR